MDPHGLLANFGTGRAHADKLFESDLVACKYEINFLVILDLEFRAQNFLSSSSHKQSLEHRMRDSKHVVEGAKSDKIQNIGNFWYRFQ